jgi:hypothetical protein
LAAAACGVAGVATLGERRRSGGAEQKGRREGEAEIAHM